MQRLGILPGCWAFSTAPASYMAPCRSLASLCWVPPPNKVGVVSGGVRCSGSELPYVAWLNSTAHGAAWRFNPGRMFSVQSRLPKLPVPALTQTLTKYLQTVKPIVSEGEYERTRQIVEKFGSSGGLGQKLQGMLEKRASALTNWLADWWLHVAYLGSRLPVVIHSSPGLVFPHQPVKGSEQQLLLAARLLRGLLNYKAMIDNKELKVETVGGQPLCMDQYYKMFSTCRVPGVKEDHIIFHPPYEYKINHVIVLCNNHIWKMDVYDSSYTLLSEADLYHQLHHIHTLSTSSDTPPAIPLGILTTENRTEWGKLHKKLSKDPQNVSHLKAIESSIIALCLDQSPQGFPASDVRSRSGHQMLHGCGSQYNSCNRWFDKTIQMVVDDEGSCGVCYEHSPAEGPPLAALMDYILTYHQTQGELRAAGGEGEARVERLEFTVTPDVVSGISTAQQRLDVLVSDIDLTCYLFDAYGKTFVKSHKLSPDSYIQVGLQLAYYRLYGEVPATYESGSTRKFQLGRTDTIRSQSMSGLAFCELMAPANTSATVEEKREALIKAVNTHKAYVNDAINGEGVDRHLLGLKLVAVEDGLNVPELHMDTSYLTSSHHKLSTSQVPSKYEVLLNFGPTAEDGYGVCYNPMKDRFLFAVSAWRRYKGTDSQRFIQSLTQAYLDMRRVLAGGGDSKL